MFRRLISSIFFCCVLSALATYVAADKLKFTGGHAKYQFVFNAFPDDSLFLDVVESPALDQNADFRLKFDWRSDKVSLVTDYQFIAQHGDSVTLSRGLPGSVIMQNLVPNDDYRLFDLTHIISKQDNSIFAHRFDRLYVDITGTNAVARLGRQAISWGNGLIYTPMDFFNPFDPSAVDKEYKTGDDIVYGQYLQKNGNDLQSVWVMRRDNSGDISNDVDSIAVKYHGFAGNHEYDLLFSEHFGDTILGLGGLADLNGAIWRGDITLTHTNNSANVTSLVTSLSYSWVGWGHNMSGVVEYFYNGFGQTDGDYSPLSLISNPALAERIIRGELYTLGRHYVAASAMVEMTPLWLLTPNVFINASDGSFLFQLVSSYDLKQDWQLLASVSLPVGATGTEYGGIDSSITGKQLGTEFNLFAQLSWYF
ncbi:MAG: hypothetical protein GY744_01035 [Gammaproteobacteria bacterium]|nr:hypothetical protein [Gammaproteobacteria bacterium]